MPIGVDPPPVSGADAVAQRISALEARVADLETVLEGLHYLTDYTTAAECRVKNRADDNVLANSSRFGIGSAEVFAIRQAYRDEADAAALLKQKLNTTTATDTAKPKPIEVEPIADVG